MNHKKGLLMGRDRNKKGDDHAKVGSRPQVLKLPAPFLGVPYYYSITTYMCAYIYIYIWIYLCVYIYINIDVHVY